MNDYNALIKELREHAEWAEANIYEVPIMLPDYLKQAADAIEADSEEEAKSEFMSEVDYGGELYGVQISCEENE